MNKKERVEYFKDFLRNNYIYNLYRDNMKCDRCGKWFKILFPVNGFQVCSTCCDKVRLELE